MTSYVLATVEHSAERSSRSWSWAIFSWRLTLAVAAATSPSMAGAQAVSAPASVGLTASSETGAPLSTSGNYRLAPGDVVEITVAGMPDLTYRTTLNVDGRVVIPLGQPILAAGLTLDALTDRVRDTISRLAFQQQSGTGGALPPTTIPKDQIAVQIVEYRPIYLNGDISKPGALTFRPGMTVRQAVAEAGGYNLLKLQMRPAVLESSELLGRLHQQQLGLLREQAVVARLREEAGDGAPASNEAAEAADKAADVSEAVGAEGEKSHAPFARIEGERAAALQDRFSDDVAHIKESLADLESRRRQMSERQKLEESAAAADRTELTRLQGLADRRVVPLERVTEARRALMLSSSRVMDATVEAGNIEKENQAMRRELDAVQNGRRSDILEQLSDSELRLRQAEASVEATKQQLTLLSGMRPDRMKSANDDVRVTIARLGETGEDLIEASLDTRLEAGDAVEIELSRDHVPF